MESESLSWNTAELKDLRVLRDIYIYIYIHFFRRKQQRKSHRSVFATRSHGCCGLEARESSRRPVPWRRALLRSRKFRQHLLLQQRFAGSIRISLLLFIIFFFVLILWLGFQFLMEFVFHRELEFFLFGLPYLKSRF